MATYYIDCEFDGHNGPLLSLAIVQDSGRSLHFRVIDAPPVSDPWVSENVIPIMGKHGATINWRGNANRLGRVLRDFIGGNKHPVIIADSPVDIGRFCQAISTGEDGGWASTDYEGMTFEVHNVDCYPTDLPGAVQHNAWWDAMALKHKLTAL